MKKRLRRNRKKSLKLTTNNHKLMIMPLRKNLITKINKMYHLQTTRMLDTLMRNVEAK